MYIEQVAILTQPSARAVQPSDIPAMISYSKQPRLLVCGAVACGVDTFSQWINSSSQGLVLGTLWLHGEK